MWSWSEVPFNNWLHRKNSILLFLSHLTEDQMQKLITELIFHQIPLLPGRWENIHLMPNYVWDLGGLMWWRVADWQVRDNCVCVCLCALTHRWHCLPAYLTACSHEETTWTHTSTAATALPAVSANRVWDWSRVTLFPLCTSTQPLILACSIKI